MTAPVVRTIDDLYRHSPQSTAVTLAIVALGANLPSTAGRPADTLKAAVTALQTLCDGPVLMSTIIETDPEDCPPGSPPFANAVAIMHPPAHFTPASFLLELQKLEAEFGRQRKGVPNEARVLDLDLISFGDQSVNTEFLTLPHPRARQRRFVMQPLAEIWPDFCFPGDSVTAGERLLLIMAGK